MYLNDATRKRSKQSPKCFSTRMHCWIARTKAHVCTCSFVHILFLIFINVHMALCMFFFAWGSSKLKSQCGRPKLSQNQSQNKVKSLGRLTHMHASPCAVRFVDCCIFLFFGACVRSYLHKRGFNGWQLFVFVCYCFSKQVLQVLISAQARLQWVTPSLHVLVPFSFLKK